MLSSAGVPGTRGTVVPGAAAYGDAPAVGGTLGAGRRDRPASHRPARHRPLPGGMPCTTRLHLVSTGTTLGVEARGSQVR